MAAIRGRGPQVVLEGFARNVARGVAGRTMRENIAAMDALVIAGLVADGNTVDGSSRNGGQPYDTVVAQYPDETTSAWEIPAPLLNISTGIMHSLTINALPGWTNPLIISAPDLTGHQTDPQLTGLHPAMVQENYGSYAQPDDMSGFAAGSTAVYHQIEYYVGGPNMNGTRAGLRIHGAQAAYSPNAPNSTVGIGGLQETLCNLGGTAGSPEGKQYAANWIVRLAGDSATTTGTGVGTNLTAANVVGTIHVGDNISGIGVPLGTTIVSQTSGTTGAAGVYVTNNPTTCTADLLVVTTGAANPATNATFMRASQGIEVDMSFEAGSSSDVKNAITAGSFFLDSVRGTTHDSAFNVSGTAGSCGFNMAYAVTDIGGRFPLRETDFVLRLVNTVGQQNILGGIDFIGPSPNRIHITGAIINAEHFVVDGPTGNVTSDGVGLFKSGLQSSGGEVRMVYAVAGTVPVVDGSYAETRITQSFLANGATTFWNCRYGAGASFDFRQIDGAGASTSVAEFTSVNAMFVVLKVAANDVAAAGLGVPIGGLYRTSAASGAPLSQRAS